ncbi:MAG TPA: glycoside hydrolase family 2 TIM barrel-domain containing protein [Verrucomicrobiae bacterium]|nr:glycoside hydrolase family 2 TIM barrel-domain containing protein [Verrucomicrobiae bacterium]
MNTLKLLAVAVLCFTSLTEAASRRVLSFDADWRFLKGNAEGPEARAFDDLNWRRVDVPHDWSIEGPFAQTNRTGGSGGFLPSGISWYRKTFSVNSNDAGRVVWIEFDGVMQNSDVWINGKHLGHRPNGYVSFKYDLTPHVIPGADNVIAVRADTSQQPSSRWYTGAGIYRHVRVVITDPLHIPQWTTFVTTPRVSPDGAVVRVQTSVTNSSDSSKEVSLRIALRNSRGRAVGQAETPSQTIAPGAAAAFEQEIAVTRPQLWSLEDPELYQAVIEVREGSKVLDEEATRFGIRTFEFNTDTGFWLNGKNFKINGVCVHHDGGAFGAAVPLAVWESRLQALRELGANAVRTAHNPVAPEFLDLCDRMGFLVMNEFFDCWTVGKTRYGYHQFFREWAHTDQRDTIRRDRNHPSVILYSIGNEIHDTPRQAQAKEIASGLVQVCKENDPTRPVTQALFRPNVSGDYTNGLADMLDVIGTNYRDIELLAAHRAKAGRKIIGTEQGHELRIWLACRDHPQHAGQFLWTGIDYLGEARRWPRVGFGSGLLDRTGHARPLAFQRQSWWSEKPMVRAVRRIGRDELAVTDPGYESADLRRPQVLFADWTPRNAEAHDESVEVFSNCAEVELVLNGKSLGSKPKPRDDSQRTWTVPYAPGTLKAIGRNDRKIVASHELRTAGKPAKLLLTADRNRISPSWDDVAMVVVTVVDENGVMIPTAADTLTFSLKGPGVVAAVDNGDNASHEPFQAGERQALQGRCVAYVKATDGGRIQLTASAPGLRTGTINISATR